MWHLAFSACYWTTSLSKTNTVNPPVSPQGANVFQAHLREGLFDLEMTMVSVLHKELEYKVEKLKYKMF